VDGRLSDPAGRHIQAGEGADEPAVVRPDAGGSPVRGRIVGNILACGAADGPSARRPRGRNAVAEVRAVERRLAFLAEASAHLASSLDYATTLGRVARSAVPEMADWCVVDTLDEDGSVRLLAVAHVEPGKEAVVRELRRRYPPDPQARYGLQKALATGRPELYPDILPAWRQGAARDAEHLRLMQVLDARSSMCVPLRARGQTLGAMTFVCAASGRRYGPPDVALAQDLADRCALALDNARLHSRLQETVRTREMFLASLAHDLKTPLTASLGYAQLLRREATKAGRSPSARRMADWAAIIEVNTARAAGLLDELLDIARLEAGHSLDLDRRPTDLVVLAKRVAVTHRRGNERHRITVDAQAPEVVGEWDAARLARVLDNLLGNGVKYSPNGGEISVRVTRESAWAVLTVADQGLGIPAADRLRIFERFERGRNVAGRVAGSGVGLAGVRHVVEQHGGTVSVESQEGVGSTFTVRLPLTSASLPSRPASARPGGTEAMP
jgi:signal transduction histidine kinase